MVETGEVVAIKRIHIKHGSQDGLPDNIFRELKSLMVGRSNCRPKGEAQVLAAR